MSGGWRIRGKVTITTRRLIKGSCCGGISRGNDFCACPAGCRCGCEDCDRVCNSENR